MDLTIPYTFYPSALPNEIAWILFVSALLGALVISFLIGKAKRPRFGFLAFVPALIAFLIATMLLSMVIAFFVHDL